MSYSSQVPLFPDKLRDLNRYTIKIGIFNRPPTIFAKVNATGYPLEFYGEDVLCIQTLSQAMNFKIELVKSMELSIGNFDCYNKSFTSGYVYRALNHEIQLIAVNGLSALHCLHSHVLFNLDNLVVVVSILKEYDVGIQVESLFYVTIAMSFLFLMIFWIVIRASLLEPDEYNSSNFTNIHSRGTKEGKGENSFLLFASSMRYVFFEYFRSPDESAINHGEGIAIRYN